MQQCFPSEKLLWLCVNVLFNADIPGSCTEAGLVASTIISLAAAVMVCNPLLPCSACQGSWLVLGTAVKSEVVQVNQLNRIKKKKHCWRLTRRMMERPSMRWGSISKFHGCFIKLPRRSICHFPQVKCSLKGHLWIFMRRHWCLLVIILERCCWQLRGRTSQKKGIWTHFIVQHTISLELSDNQICATNHLLRTSAFYCALAIQGQPAYKLVGMLTYW